MKKPEKVVPSHEKAPVKEKNIQCHLVKSEREKVLSFFFPSRLNVFVNGYEVKVGFKCTTNDRLIK